MTRGQTILGFALSLISCLALSCSSGTGVVRTGPHRPAHEKDPIRVRTMPPVVLVEAIPLRRNKECEYQDGAWTTDGSDWVWEKGAWILAPEDCYYAPPQTTYEEFDVGAALVHRKGAWHNRSHPQKTCAPVQPCPASEGN